MEYKNLVFAGPSCLYHSTHLWCFSKIDTGFVHGVLLPPRSQNAAPTLSCVGVIHQSAYKHSECCPACWPPKTHQCGLMAVWAFGNTVNRRCTRLCSKHKEKSASCFGVAKLTKAKRMNALVDWWCIKGCFATILLTSLSHHIHLVLQKTPEQTAMSASSSFQPKLPNYFPMSARLHSQAHRRVVMVSVSCQPRSSPK